MGDPEPTPIEELKVPGIQVDMYIIGVPNNTTGLGGDVHAEEYSTKDEAIPDLIKSDTQIGDNQGQRNLRPQRGR